MEQSTANVVPGTESSEGSSLTRNWSEGVIWRITKVCEVTGLSRSSVYGLAKKKLFPAPMKISVRASGWSSLAVIAYLNKCQKTK
jgi:predicted DNA-binding transcriptional regulator AlpA